ncbi:MAG: alpha/beta hydrolase [Rubricoccaceae bacterium]
MNKRMIVALSCLVLSGACDSGPAVSDGPDERFFLQSDGALMPVRVRGNIESGHFLIFLHGGPGDTIVNARDFADAAYTPIESDVAVVYWDQRCAGISQGACDPQELSLESYTRDLDRLVAVLEHRYGADIDLSILSHSFGSWIAAYYLSENNRDDRFEKWINVDGSYSAPLIFSLAQDMILAAAERQIAYGNEVAGWEALRLAVGSADLSTLQGRHTVNMGGATAADLMTRVDSVHTPRTVIGASAALGLSNELVTTIFNNVVTESAPFNTEIFSLDHTSRLAEIDLPVLLIWGKYDFTVPPAVADDFVRHVGSTQVQTLIMPHSEHTPMTSEPEAFGAAVTDFLR